MSGEKKVVRKAIRLEAEERGDSANKPDVPLYLQIVSTLRNAIVRGIYPVGSRIPTEGELCERFDVSRHTIREALRRLRSDGLITSRHGSRPIVVPPSAQGVVRMWSAEVSGTFFDSTMGTRLAIQSMEMVRVSKALAASVGIEAGEQWLRITGYRHPGEHGPATAWYEYLVNARYATVGRLLPRHVGPVVLLIEDLFSIKIVTMKYAISAVQMPAEQAAVLRVAAGSPALRTLTRCEAADAQLVMVAVSLHRGGHVGYAITLQDRG